MREFTLSIGQKSFGFRAAKVFCVTRADPCDAGADRGFMACSQSCVNFGMCGESELSKTDRFHTVDRGHALSPACSHGCRVFFFFFFFFFFLPVAPWLDCFHVGMGCLLFSVALAIKNSPRLPCFFFLEDMWEPTPIGHGCWPLCWPPLWTLTWSWVSFRKTHVCLFCAVSNMLLTMRQERFLDDPGTWTFPLREALKNSLPEPAATLGTLPQCRPTPKRI